MHWVGWEKMKLSNKEGGLGFWDLHFFNMAMLAKQGWHLIQEPNSLCAQVLRAKYFPARDVLAAEPVKEMSYVWRSILKGMDVLKEGLIWRIGDGTKVRVWEDPWIPRGVTRLPSTGRGQSLISRVSELIDPITGTWDQGLVADYFHPDDIPFTTAGWS